MEILDDFLVSSIKTWFADDEVISQDNNSSSQKAKDY